MDENRTLPPIEGWESNREEYKEKHYQLAPMRRVILELRDEGSRLNYRTLRKKTAELDIDLGGTPSLWYACVVLQNLMRQGVVAPGGTTLTDRGKACLASLRKGGDGDFPDPRELLGSEILTDSEGTYHD